MRSEKPEFNDTSKHVVTVLGPRLWVPKAAAVVLCLYATAYSLLVLSFVFIAGETLGAFVWFLGALALAVTPFIALIHLSRATTPESTAPARPLMMMVITAAPTLYWGFALFSGLSRGSCEDFGDVSVAVGLIAVPAILSFWLFVTFVLLAFRGEPSKDHF